MSTQVLELMRLQVSRYGQEVMDFFEDRVAEGVAPRFAAMLACQSPPGTKGTDRSFLEGRHDNQHITERNLKGYLDIAKKSGVVTTGKIHVSGLGPPSDPKAWVSSLGEVEAVCKERNYSAKGALNIEGRPMQIKPKKLSDDIVNENVKRILKKEPRTAEAVKKNPKKLAELKERIIDERTPHYKK